MTTINLSTPADLYTLMIAPAPGPSGTYSLADSYVVIQPINMTGYALPSESIGNTDFNNGFTGNFNGGNFLITINNTVASYNGLFSINFSIPASLKLILKLIFCIGFIFLISSIKSFDNL